MKKVLFGVLLLCSIGVMAQNKKELSSREALFNGPFVLKKQMSNPQKEAGKMLVKASNWKYTAGGFAAISAGVWLFNKDAKHTNAIKTVSIVGGASAIICYLVGARYEWMAGKYLQFSASPSEVTASIKF